jgi:two-component system, NarL family, invasion response regulator UvrY
MKRFLLIDDHTIIRAALRTYCQENFPDAIIEESADGIGIMEKFAVNHYHLVIIDIQIPNCETLWLINCIHLNYPDIPVLVFSMTSPEIYALRVMKAGAKGFVSKDAPLEELEMAIGLALQGKKYICQAIANQVGEKTFASSYTPFDILSKREIQIASLLLSGHTVTEISKLLDLGLSTVGTHKANIFSKLNVKNLMGLKEISDVYRF